MKTPSNKIAPDVTGPITLEMIAAAVREYLSYDARFEDYEDVVVRIWDAVQAAKT